MSKLAYQPQTPLARIARTDTMLNRPADTSSLSHYFSVGLSAIAIIQSALHLTDINPVRILDMPCGHGRVTRFIKACFPWAHIYSCDINKEAVDFCSKTFQTHAVYSHDEFGKIAFPEEIAFDLIWVGSLITHFPEDRTIQLIRFCLDNISSSGIAIITSHGKHAANRIREATHETWLTGEGRGTSLLSDYDQKGYGYIDYPGESKYGFSLIQHDWFTRMSRDLEFEILSFTERAWDMHHDVIVMRNRQQTA